MMDLVFLAKVKRWAIIALFSDDELMDRLVLKGGNLIDVVYGISARSSMDVDFSMPGEFDLAELRGRLTNALESIFREHGLVAFDITVEEKPERMTEDMKAFWGGYDVFFKVIDTLKFDALKDYPDKLRRNAATLGERNSTRFQIQISKFEECEPKEAHDLDGYRVYGYSPQLFVCEKIRAICQQTPEYRAIVRNHPSARARDFVDICLVGDHFDLQFDTDEFRQIVRRVFGAKRVPLELIGRIDAYREFHRPDFVSVSATVHADIVLDSFDFYFDRVLELCQSLQSLWHE